MSVKIVEVNDDNAGRRLDNYLTSQLKDCLLYTSPSPRDPM